jgi:formylmethanofuran dehydrogenase subunit C
MLLIEIKSCKEDYLCDFTYDFFWQHNGSRLDPDRGVAGWSRRQLVEALKRGETVRINGDAGSMLGSSLGVDLVRFGGKGGPIQETGSVILNGDAGKRMGISMLRGAIYISGRAMEPIGNIIEVESDRTGYRKYKSITEVLERSIPVLEPNLLDGEELLIKDGIIRETVGARNQFDKAVLIDGDAGMSTGILMRSGSIQVSGDVGRNTGVLMSGGKIVVKGSAGDFTGTEMRGGEIFIKGDGGGFTCAKMRAGSVYARFARPVHPAKEHILDNNELAAVAKALDLNFIHAMSYRRWSL